MWKNIIVLVGSLSLLLMQGHGQFKKQFFVAESADFNEVSINLEFNSGTCMLKSSQEPGVFSIYSLHTIEELDHVYKKNVSNGVCKIDLALEDAHKKGLTQSISSNFFGSDSENNMEKYWKILVSENKIYDLVLEYGVGNANLDLSNLSIRNIKIHTGSADVDVGYFSDSFNKVEMDTFFVKVDLGNVKVRNLHQARSSFIRADVGFGNLYLDLKNPAPTGSYIKGNVGAGNLYISLPSDSKPVKLKINDSWLCSFKLPKGYVKISENTFANEQYVENPKNALEFELDVSMGSLVFN